MAFDDLTPIGQVILFDASGNALAVQDGTAIPAGTPSLVVSGSDGTAARRVRTDSSGRLEVVQSGSTAVVRGFSDGRIVQGTTSVNAVRATAYSEQGSGAQRSLVSSSANDSSAGTGARTVRITYYALSGSTVTGPFTETVTLDGTTAVDTAATDICYIEKIEVLTVGSGLVNAGVISLKASIGGGGATVWSVAAGDNRTFGSHHYVPSSRTALVTGFLGGIKGADTTGFVLRARNPADSSSAEIQVSDLLRVPSSGQSFRTYPTPIQVPGPSVITAYAVPDSTSTRTYYASFDYYEQ